MEATLPVHSHLKVARKAAQKTAEQAAVRLGVGVDMIYRYESGRSDIALSDLARLAEFYGMQIGDIFPGSKPRTRELQPFLMALEDFEPEERPALVDRATRELAFLSMMMNGRESRRDRSENLLLFPLSAPKEMSDDALDRLIDVMKKAGAEPRKAARGPEREVRFYGLASAGEGIEFFDDIPEEYRQIPQWAWRKGARGVFKAAGESMMDVGIFPDDILFIKPTPRPKNGTIAILTVNKRVFVKKLKLDEYGRPTHLLSKNQAYKPIEIQPDDEVEFFGEVVGRTGDL